ncbi:MAG: nucleotidyltransferase family protein [Saprospiraceae bacterium]|nr:nucleotidyltransferase family protein [Saprospiraceae bacterium]
MKAMIFAAGLGTRLRPLTANKPKALVEIGGIPLLGIALRRLRKYGCKEVVVNVHHFADQVRFYLSRQLDLGMAIHISDETGMLLHTGGGLKKASRWFSGSPFLVVNADVLTNMNFAELMQKHRTSNAIATLAVRKRTSSRMLIFGRDQQLAGWTHTVTGERKMSRVILPEEETLLAFSGIQVIDPALFDFFPEKEIFSTIDLYLAAAKTERIVGINHDKDIWVDVGKLPAIQEAESVLNYIDM